VRCKLQWVSYIFSKRHELIVHKRLYIGSEISPTLRKFCIPLHYQSSQTQISKRNSTKFCHTVDGKSPWQSTVVNDVVTPEKIGGEKLLHLFVFSTTSTQWRECLQNERDIDNRERTLENTKGLLRCPKIS